MSIKSIQKNLKKNNIQGHIITMSNLFIGEEIRNDENKIKRLTGFSGSTALLYITAQKAYLFVDGRYTIQAKKETNSKIIEIINQEKDILTTLTEFIKKLYKNTSASIFYNPWQITPHFLTHLQKNLPHQNFIPELEPDLNLTTDTSQTFTLKKTYSGLSSKEKISCLTKYLKHQNLDYYLITSSANISWLLNIRSNALPYTPIFRAYVLLKKDGTYQVFADSSDYSQALPFKTLEKNLKTLKKIGTDFRTAPSIIIKFNPAIKDIKDPIENLKSIKNPTELKGFQNAHIRDGVALTKFFYWLSKNYTSKTELDIVAKLTSLRQEEKNYYSASFPTISAYGANGAIVHYQPTPKTNSVIKKGSLLLLDSGAQYYDGTTDVTRTVAIGIPQKEMQQNYTLVLKAHIALSGAVFLENTSGEKLDILSRNVLLKNNLNYAHGTGHGVGHFSNVHEGPNNISVSSSSTPLKEGMITSIEPGYYKENHYGIRIENLYQIINIPKTPYLTFSPLTLVPFDKNLILPNLLTSEEKDYINAYHKKVYNTLKKYLTTLELKWLEQHTSPI